MKFKTLFLTVFALILLSFCPDKKAYQIFDEKGKKSDFKDLLKQAEKADIILFGELHNNPIIHWLQLEFTKDVFFNINDNLVLGAEMFESDNQLIINEYLGGHYNYEIFKKEAKVWPNNTTDYLPLLDFALANQLPFIATNIPRRYANMVYKNGFTAFNNISDEAKRFIAPLPIAYDEKLPGYVSIKQTAGGHGGDNLPKSQATKDATMAHFIIKNWKQGATFIHYNGTYHSKNFEGIVWYLKRLNPELKVMTINCVEQDKIEELDKEHEGSAHFIVATPQTMTKTH